MGKEQRPDSYRTDAVVLLEDRDGVASAVEVVRAREAGHVCADDEKDGAIIWNVAGNFKSLTFARTVIAYARSTERP